MGAVGVDCRIILKWSSYQLIEAVLVQRSVCVLMNTVTDFGLITMNIILLKEFSDYRFSHFKKYLKVTIVFYSFNKMSLLTKKCWLVTKRSTRNYDRRSKQ